MKLGAALLFLALLVAAAPARASDADSCQRHQYAALAKIDAVCSATWQFTAPCTGQDMWADWKVSGPPYNPPDALIRPWLDVPIVVVGYELVKLRALPRQPDLATSRMEATTSWFMVGNLIQPDAILWLAPGETHALRMWNPGQGQVWPSKQAAMATKPVLGPTGKVVSVNGDLLDIHGLCFSGSVTLFLTMYFYIPKDVRTDENAGAR